ncbi:PilZ domain-containing protein [Paraburkholderia kururiensis]|uniref:hypothetical protein n=1 Tax=Paraburkholderia kururiensis TaxID=984307 RepID=UPI0039A41933
MMTRNSERRESVRKELLATSKRLCSKSDRSALGLALRRLLPNLERAFVLKWVPEQGEDIYWVLTGSAEVVTVELPRGQPHAEKSAALQMTDVATFQCKHHSRDVREKLEIALELVRA